MKVALVCGARPNFMKIAPLLRAIQKHNEGLAANDSRLIDYLLVHTGQHYDYEMSQVFFQELELPQPDIYLGIGSGTHAEQTGRIMIEFEKVLIKEKPDLVVVVGDVNSTLAAALAAVKIHIPVAHVEAGLRSYDRTMPEEINRLLTDAISDYLFTPSPDADENLKREGIADEKIFFVGNVMVDSLLFNKAKAEKSDILERLRLVTHHPSLITHYPSPITHHSLPITITHHSSPITITPYALLTLHRPSNVDDKQSLVRIITALKEIAQTIPIVFPAHPRTKKKIKDFELEHYLINSMTEGYRLKTEDCGIYYVDPLGYLDFLKLEMNAKFVMTDSGGIEPETTVLGIPCLTLLDTTGWEETISQGTNTLVGNDTNKIIAEAFKILDGEGKRGICPELWDDKTAERMVEILAGSRYNWQKEE